MKKKELKKLERLFDKYKEYNLHFEYDRGKKCILIYRCCFLSLRILEGLKIEQGHFLKVYHYFSNIKELVKYVKNHFKISKFDDIEILRKETVLWQKS